MGAQEGQKEATPVFPRSKKERIVTLAAALLVLVGGLLAVAAWRSARQTQQGAGDAPPPPAEATPIPTGPLAGLTILVDPGHGGYDGGARCRDSGKWEKEINLAVALEVEKALTQRGAAVLMTRRADEDLCEPDRPASVTKKRQDMQNRVDMAVAGHADMVLSIHMNEYRVRSESGPQVFYRAGCESGRLLAGCMQSALIEALQPKKERAAMAGDYFILQLDVPSVLVECGFISNPTEEALLLNTDYQAQIGQAVADGVTEYLTLQKGLDESQG